MSNSQKWVLAFLVIFLLLFVLVQVTKEDDNIGHTPATNPVPQTDISSDVISAADLITRQGCRGCHGAELEGSRLGPALTNIGQYWSSRDELINYLRNPNSFMDRDRFRKYQEQYPGVLMPSFSNVDVKDLGRIADYLINY
jgi:hypothetical protein